MNYYFVLKIGTTIHEIGHTLGLIHEHSRPDRDLYLIANPSASQYLLRQHDMHTFADSAISTYNIPYDPGSIMHYPYFVSANLPVSEQITF